MSACAERTVPPMCFVPVSLRRQSVIPCSLIRIPLSSALPAVLVSDANDPESRLPQARLPQARLPPPISGGLCKMLICAKIQNSIELSCSGHLGCCEIVLNDLSHVCVIVIHLSRAGAAVVAGASVRYVYLALCVCLFYLIECLG